MNTKEELESQACVEKRERMFRKLQTTYDLIKTLPTNETVFLVRAEKAEDEFKLFEDVQDKLARLNLLITDKVPIDTVSIAYEEMYYHLRAKAQDIKNEKSKSTAENVKVTHDVKYLRPKLPPIDIPKFKGDLEKFPAFKSLYDTLIHKTDLSPIQKFSFLKSYLEYPALNVIDNFDFTDENYQAAYDKLVERYTDKRLVGTHYLNKLLQFKTLTNGSCKNLQQFIDVFCVQFESLKALKIPDLADFVIFNLAMIVLDQDTKRLFEDKHSKTSFPTFQELVLFIKEQHKVASLVQPPNVGKTVFTPSKSSLSTSGARNTFTKSFMLNNVDSCESKGTVKVSGNELKSKCSLCKSDHKLYVCSYFQDMDPISRFEKVKSLKLCFACLGPHARASCTTKFSCRKCQSKNHHTLLHREQVKQTELKESNSKEVSKDNSSTEAHTKTLSCHVNQQGFKSSSTTGLLGTAKGRVKSSSGDWVICRMLVDPASESSFITESFAQCLRLPRQKCSVDVVGVGSSTFTTNRGRITCKVSPLHDHDSVLTVEAIVLPRISSNMPKVSLNSDIRNKFKHLQLADLEFDKPGPVDMLLGVQHYSEILSDCPTLIKGEPAALSTIFGFMIFGKIPERIPLTTSVSMFTHTSLDEMLCRFWESEEPSCNVPPNISDFECEKFFSETTTRDSLGRYQVSLPFKDGIVPSNLGSTRDIAHKRLLSLERRLSRNPILKDQYNGNLQDYVSNDHMRPASSSSIF